MRTVEEKVYMYSAGRYMQSGRFAIGEIIKITASGQFTVEYETERKLKATARFTTHGREIGAETDHWTLCSEEEWTRRRKAALPRNYAVRARNALERLHSDASKLLSKATQDRTYLTEANLAFVRGLIKDVDEAILRCADPDAPVQAPPAEPGHC